MVALLPLALQGRARPMRGQLGGASLTESIVLARMDQAALNVKTISARLTKTQVTVLVNDRSTQSGTIYYKKGKKPRLLIQFAEPQVETILIRRDHASIYYPRLNQIQEFNLQQRRDVMQQFLLLGFGTQTSELKESYHLKYLGVKNLDGQETPELELTPRSQSVAHQLTKVDLWISERNWLPVQQEFYQPSGDYLIARYAGLKVNAAMPRSVFKIKAKPGVQRVKMD
jgi:outer membrane lipoprotein-sorting protein